jgi:hypothetical protein
MSSKPFRRAIASLPWFAFVLLSSCSAAPEAPPVATFPPFQNERFLPRGKESYKLPERILVASTYPVSTPWGPGNSQLFFLDANNREVRPSIPAVEMWFMAGPYVYYRVDGTDHVLDEKLAPVTTLSNVVVSNWSNPRCLFALDLQGSFLVLRDDVPEVGRIPGRWRGIIKVPAASGDQHLYLERLDDDLADIAVVTQYGPSIRYRDVVSVTERSLDGLPNEVGGRDIMGHFNLVIVQSRPAGRNEWAAYKFNDMSFLAKTTGSEDSACAAAEAYLRERATQERLSAEAQQRLAAKALEDRVARCTASLDSGQAHANDYLAAIEANNLAQAKTSALALHEAIAHTYVPEGHALSSILSGRLNTLRSIGVDWSARRPDRTLATVAAWLPVAFDLPGNDYYWQAVDRLVAACTTPPNDDDYRRLLTYRVRLSEAARGRMVEWAKAGERARYKAALARGDWSGAMAIAASIDPVLWCEALLSAPVGLLNTQLIDTAIQQVGPGPLMDRLRDRRVAEVAAANRYSSPTPGNNGASSGGGIMDGINDLNRRMYQGNLRRYGLPSNY